VSKQEHDSAAAILRGARRHVDRAWYRSAGDVLERHRLRGLTCLDLCAGNAEFSEILRDRFAMRVTCADYAPAHLEHQRSLGFDTLLVDLDGQADAVDRAAAARTEAFDLVVSLAAIEHVFDSDNFLRFCHTILKPGGLLLVNTPNIAFAGYQLSMWLNGGRPFGEGHHVRFWNFRFLRTNLFLNGFGVIDDARGYFGLPSDVMTRALRGRHRAGQVLARLFGVCRGLQRLPGLRGWCTDELTVLARKEPTAPIGFQYRRIRSALDQLQGRPEREDVLARLRAARKRGWLDEHLMLKALVDEAAP
jgi:SAM-dependent methyltransferase